MSFLYEVEEATVNIIQATSEEQAISAQQTVATSAIATGIINEAQRELAAIAAEVAADGKDATKAGEDEELYQYKSQFWSNQEQQAQSLVTENQGVNSEISNDEQNDVQFAGTANDMESYLSSQLQQGY